MDLILAYGAGLLTLVNPCILPVLPVVLASALQAGRAGPLALTAGMCAAFVGLGLLLAAAGPALGLREERVATVAALAMAAFGLALLLPAAGARLAAATAGLAARADARMARLEARNLAGQAAGGALLGAVWSPCVGPTLGAAIGLAASGGSLPAAGAVMAAFAAGVASVMLALAFGARAALARHRGAAQALAARARPALGLAFLAVGLAVATGLSHRIEAWLLDLMPVWLQDLSVAL